MIVKVRLLPFDAVREEKVAPHNSLPRQSRTNIVSASEIVRQLEGRPEAMSQKHISGTAKRLEKDSPLSRRDAACRVSRREDRQAPSLQGKKITACSWLDQAPVRDTREVSA